VIDWFADAFASELTQRALLGGLLAAITTASIGTWVVVRGMSFMGDALAHGVLPGIALAFAWGIDLTLGAMVSAAVMVAGIDVVHRRARLPEDTGIGLLFVGMLALGVVIISREESYAGDLTSFLFGDILGIRTADLWFQGGVAAATLVAVVVLYRPFLALSFHRDKAASLGLRPALAHVAMLVLLALAVVSSFQVAGTLLVFGLLIAPPATATLLVRRLPAIMAVGTALGCLAVVLGLAISYHADTAASATVAGIAVAQFFLALAGREVVTALRRRPSAAAAASAS
jgi:ABC-type Mn2+/Zn2+ transport system permease subunit